MDQEAYLQLEKAKKRKEKNPTFSESWILKMMNRMNVAIILKKQVDIM